MNPFLGIDIESLQAWLASAQTALATGRQLTSAAIGDMRVSFNPSDPRQVIADLQAAISAAALNARRTKGVYLR